VLDEPTVFSDVLNPKYLKTKTSPDLAFIEYLPLK
jgi:hypothetical protein